MRAKMLVSLTFSTSSVKQHMRSSCGSEGLRRDHLARPGLTLDLPEDSRTPGTGCADDIARHAVERELREQREDHRFLDVAVEEHVVEAPYLARREQRLQALEENRMARAAAARKDFGHVARNEAVVLVGDAARGEFHGGRHDVLRTRPLVAIPAALDELAHVVRIEQ